MTQLDFDTLLREKSCYSVSELTREIKHLLEYQFEHVWVQGEISNFTHHASGHMYFSLKDEGAQIACVMWRSQNARLRFAPQDGLRITVNARLAVYEKRGIYQLDIVQMQPAGVGELQLAYEQLKRRLQDEGLFDATRKQSLPPYPRRIGLITSPSGAAIQDFLSVASRRFPGIEIILYPVRVQGDGASREIAEAVDAFNAYGDVDVLVITRGGGSLEDLWAFNEENVARAVSRSSIPVISAVGHEVDFTICDFVADLRAPTPSTAAEMVIPDRKGLQASLQQVRESMTELLLARIQAHRERLAALTRSYALRQPEDRIRQQAQLCDELWRRMNAGMQRHLEISRSAANNLGNKLNLLDHVNVLQRGYVLCRRPDTGQLIKRVATLDKSDAVEIQFFDGSALGTIDAVQAKA